MLIPDGPSVRAAGHDEPGPAGPVNAAGQLVAAQPKGFGPVHGSRLLEFFFRPVLFDQVVGRDVLFLGIRG